MYYLFIWPYHTACDILVPQPEVKPRLLAVKKKKVLTTGPPGNFCKQEPLRGAVTFGILTGGEPRVSLNVIAPYPSHQTSLVAQQIKNLLAVQETLVQFLGQEVALEKG